MRELTFAKRLHEHSLCDALGRNVIPQTSLSRAPSPPHHPKPPQSGQRGPDLLGPPPRGLYLSDLGLRVPPRGLWVSSVGFRVKLDPTSKALLDLKYSLLRAPSEGPKDLSRQQHTAVSLGISVRRFSSRHCRCAVRIRQIYCETKLVKVGAEPNRGLLQGACGKGLSVRSRGISERFKSPGAGSGPDFRYTYLIFLQIFLNQHFLKSVPFSLGSGRVE